MLLDHTGDISAENLTVLNLVRMTNNTGNTNVSPFASKWISNYCLRKTDVGHTDISHQLLQGYSGKNRLAVKGDTGNIQIK